MPPAIEYWVMRRMMHEGQPVRLDSLTPGAAVAVQGLVSSGNLAVLPDNTLAFPVEVFDVEEMAHEHCGKLRDLYPNERFRVVMNADVTV